MNPLALGWFVRRWNPEIIYLVRHPAAVAASFMARGRVVGPDGYRRRFPAERLAREGLVTPAAGGSPLWDLGAVQAITLKLALERLAAAPDHLVIRYEELCTDPHGAFRRLFDFAGLAWSGEVEAAVVRQSGAQGNDRSDAYGTTRDSRRMATAWRDDLSPGQIEEVREGYSAHQPPTYGAESWEW